MCVSINHQSVFLIQKSQGACVFKVDLFSTYDSYLYILDCDFILYKRKSFIGSDFLLMFLSYFVNILGSMCIYIQLQYQQEKCTFSESYAKILSTKATLKNKETRMYEFKRSSINQTN